MYTDELSILLNFWSIQIKNSLEAFKETSLILHLIDDLKSLLFNMVCQASRQKYKRKNILNSILFVNYMIRDVKFDLQMALNSLYKRDH